MIIRTLSCLLLGIIWVAVFTGCDSNRGGVEAVLLRIDETELTGLDFQRFLTGHLAGDLDDEMSEAEPAGAEVRSRLFDLFVDEQLMLEEARLTGIEISETDVEIYLADIAEPSDHDRKRAVARLAQLQLQEAWADDVEPVSDDEVDRFLATEGRVTIRRVELRSLLLPDADEATRVHRQISRRRMTFDEAIALHQDPEMPNRPFRVTWETADPLLQAALEGLKPGQISQPQNLHGNSYLFQFLGRVEEQDDISRQQWLQAQKTLKSRRQRDQQAEKMAELRDRIDHQRYPGRLLFSYRNDSLADG